MTRSQIIVLSLLEVIAVATVAHLWIKRRRMNSWLRLGWSVVLLIPFFGVLIYGLFNVNPDEHPYDTDSTSGSAASEASGGDGHG